MGGAILIFKNLGRLLKGVPSIKDYNSNLLRWDDGDNVLWDDGDKIIWE